MHLFLSFQHTQVTQIVDILIVLLWFYFSWSYLKKRLVPTGLGYMIMMDDPCVYIHTI